MQYSVKYAGYAENAEPAEKLTAEGAYHCPVGSIWLFFLLHCHRLPGYPTHIHPLPRKIGQGLKTIQKMVRTE